MKIRVADSKFNGNKTYKHGLAIGNLMEISNGISVCDRKFSGNTKTGLSIADEKFNGNKKRK